MIQDTVNAVEKLIDAAAMMADVRALANFERYHASKGFEKAAEWCLNRLTREGADARILEYPADGVTTLYETQFAPKEWVCGEGYCICDGVTLADRSEKPISVLERCGRQIEKAFELVLADKGAKREAYTGVDFNGKAVLLRGAFPHEALWMFGERGASGVIVSEKSSPGGPDALRWFSMTSPELSEVFGFAVSPAAGDALAEKIRIAAESGKAVTVRCYVDAAFTDSNIQNVTAFIPGQSDKEVLLVAHLCHPRGSANDNLSGCAAAMEAFIALRRAIESGLLEKPKFALRILLVPEYLGSYAYVASLSPTERDNILGGLDLDMVGSSQNGHNAPLTLCEPPMACRSFVTDLAHSVLKRLRKDACITSKYGYVPLFTSLVTTFTGGSDHAVFSDPALFAPMPMLGQVSDRFYHTDKDLPETLDTFMLRKSAVLAAAYAYTLANMAAADVKEIMLAGRERLSQRLSEMARGGETDLLALYAMHYLEWQLCALDDIRRFIGTENIENVLNKEKQVRRCLARAFFDRLGLDIPPDTPIVHPKAVAFLRDETYAWIPERRFTGPVHDLKRIMQMRNINTASYDDYLNDAPDYSIVSVEHQMEYYIDGRRTAAQIINETLLEGRAGREPELLYRYLLILEEAGLIYRKQR